MPMSEAAMDGIRDNGHRWKNRIYGLKPFTEVIGKANTADNDGKEYDAKVVEEAVKGVVSATRTFATGAPEPVKGDLEYRADNLEMVEDCELEDINYYMGELYDSFDYHRILVS